MESTHQTRKSNSLVPPSFSCPPNQRLSCSLSSSENPFPCIQSTFMLETKLGKDAGMGPVGENETTIKYKHERRRTTELLTAQPVVAQSKDLQLFQVAYGQRNGSLELIGVENQLLQTLQSPKPVGQRACTKREMEVRKTRFTAITNNNKNRL